MSDWVVAGMFVLLVLVVLIYRQDALRTARRREEQNEHWGTAQTKVLEMLEATERLLREQQNANKLLEHHNAVLTERITEIQAELKTVTAELRAVRLELTNMTSRATAAEERTD